MKLWKKPRLAAALCAVVVLVCAAAPKTAAKDSARERNSNLRIISGTL